MVISTSWIDAKAAPFVPMAATYNGLFFETNSSWQQSSGFFTLKTTARGTYTGTLRIGQVRYPFSGRIGADGSAVAYTSLRDNPRTPTLVTVSFQVDPEDPDLLYGSVEARGWWISSMIADRAVFNGKTSVCPDAGRYTMIIPGDPTSTVNPGGHSYGTLKIGPAGGIQFVGTLADGTKFTQSTTVSKGGNWPLYSPLYQGGGSLYGWMLVNGSSTDELSGDVTWIRPQRPTAWYYPDGFAIAVSAWGARYVRPPGGTRVVNAPAATIEFNGAYLGMGITNVVTIDTSNRVKNTSSNGLKLTFWLDTGTFSGKVLHPATRQWISFKGAVLQTYDLAAGFFLDYDRSGEAWLQPY